MKYSLFSLCLILAACSSQYKGLRKVESDHICLETIRPTGIETGWFDASVDVMGRHISGLLLIKNMPDSAYRIVFTNEIGITLFDFEFNSDGIFELKKIIPQLDRRPVINTLRTDFSLALGLYFRKDVQTWARGEKMYYGVSSDGDTFYFISDTKCSVPMEFEMGSRRKRKVSVVFKGEVAERPDEITISHHTFGMVINLKKIRATHG